MPGIVITGIENIDEEPDYEKLERERAARLREDRLRRTQNVRGREAQVNQQLQSEDAIRQQQLRDERARQQQQQQTSVQVTNTPNGTTQTTTTTSTNGTTTTTTTSSTSGGSLSGASTSSTAGASNSGVVVDQADDPFTEEVEGAADTPVNPPPPQENVNTEEAKKEQAQIEGFDQPQIDAQTESDLLKQGIDSSDIKKGEENKIESIPDNPKTNPNDPVINKTENNGNADTKTEHCTIDNPPQTKQEEKQEEKKEEKPENVLIGEDPNAPKSEIVIPDASATCPSPNLNSLNDFQKEVLWVVMDILKWQPTTDIGNNGRKRFWEYYSLGLKGKELLNETGVTQESFYKSYKYPDDPTFGRFKHKGVLPLDRLLSFYGQHDQKNVVVNKAPNWAWCAVTASVIYMYAMLQMKVSHRDIKKQNKNGETIWSPFENKKIQIPFHKNTFSARVVAQNAEYFGYKLSWEPTPGAIMFKVNNEGASGDCGHAGIVIDKTKDGSMITVEGNGSDDYHIRVWTRDSYYQDAWLSSHPGTYIKKRIFGGNKPPPFNKCTEDQIRSGRLVEHNDCGYNGSKKWWVNSNVPYPYPTDSKWHWIFVNPATETELLDIKGNPSREGNPLPEFYSMLDGFYNPEGSKGTGNSTETR